MHAFLSGRHSKEQRRWPLWLPKSALTCVRPSGGSVRLDWAHWGSVRWLPAEHSGHLRNLRRTRGLCGLSSQWLILAYSCPWWYVKYSVASLFLSFLWSLCRNVSGLQARCLRAQLGDRPPLTFLHEKRNFTPYLKRLFLFFFHSLSRTEESKGQQSFLREQRSGRAAAESRSLRCSGQGCVSSSVRGDR